MFSCHGERHGWSASLFIFCGHDMSCWCNVRKQDAFNRLINDSNQCPQCNYPSCYRKRCHRCVVIYEKHKNVLQYKESECEEKDHFNPSALTSRSIIKSDQNRGVAIHPNMNGNSRLSSSDQFVNFRSNDDNNDDCKQTSSKIFLFFWFNFHKVYQKKNQLENQNNQR